MCDIICGIAHIETGSTVHMDSIIDNSNLHMYKGELEVWKSMNEN